MLAYQWQAERGLPVVFLHGLLGSQDDWAEVFALLQNFPEIRPLAIDLPYHNRSAKIGCQDFDECRALLHATLQQTVGAQPFYLVGYSLGGRLALDYALNQTNPFLQGALLEGANIGLKTEQEKAARWQNDLHWASRFETEHLPDVLNAWYQQPVFADLSADKRAEFVQKRQYNNGADIARMLRATSLAKQQDFSRSYLLHQTPEIHFIIGENDHKFRQMAAQHRLRYRLIAHAGHNTHQANPTAFVNELIQFIGAKNGTTSLPRLP